MSADTCITQLPNDNIFSDFASKVEKNEVRCLSLAKEILKKCNSKFDDACRIAQRLFFNYSDTDDEFKKKFLNISKNLCLVQNDNHSCYYYKSFYAPENYDDKAIVEFHGKFCTENRVLEACRTYHTLLNVSLQGRDQKKIKRVQGYLCDLTYFKKDDILCKESTPSSPNK